MLLMNRRRYIESGCDNDEDKKHKEAKKEKETN
jgi:hypothetical protein